jgi:hypothetical protein
MVCAGVPVGWGQIHGLDIVRDFAHRRATIAASKPHPRRGARGFAGTSHD